MMLLRWFGPLALFAGSGAAQAQVQIQATVPCITRPAAVSLLTAFLPDILTAASVRCAPALPPQAMLRQGLPTLVEHFHGDSERAWPHAYQAVGQMLPPQLRGLDPNVLRPMATAIIVPLVAGRIDTRDCARLDQAVSLLSPLPAQNIAELAVLAIETDAARHPQQQAGLPLCLDRR